MLNATQGPFSLNITGAGSSVLIQRFADTPSGISF